MSKPLEEFRDSPVYQLLLAEFAAAERAQQDRQVAAIRADPKAHKMTRLIGAGPDGQPLPASYRYIRAGKDGRNREIRYCWSVHRNAAGFFLGWREVAGKREVKRDTWTARRVRRRLIRLAEKRSAAFKARPRKKRGAQ